MEISHKRPSELVRGTEAVKDHIHQERIKLAEKIQREVNAFVLPHKYALPPQLGIGRSKEKPVSEDGKLVGAYVEYDVESGELNEVTEQYFESGSQLPIILSRRPMGKEPWIDNGTKVIDTVTSLLPKHKTFQS